MVSCIVIINNITCCVSYKLNPGDTVVALLSAQKLGGWEFDLHTHIGVMLSNVNPIAHLWTYQLQ